MAQKKKAPTEVEAKETLINQENNNTTEEEKSTQDNLKGRHCTYVIYPESAPEDWREQLNLTGIPWSESPLHDQDKNPDESDKKNHWHIIRSWENQTTFRNMRQICEVLKCPLPQMMNSVKGMWRYFLHLDNPEKHQYEDTRICHLGWQPPIQNEDVRKILGEIPLIVVENDCEEYIELLNVAEEKGPEYLEIITNHTLYCAEVIRGYRYNAEKVIMRYADQIDEEILNKLMEKARQKRQMRKGDRYESDN